MNNQDLQEIVKRLKKLEGVVFSNEYKEKQDKSTTSPKKFIGAKGGVLLLIENNFFIKPRTTLEIRTAMIEKGYHYQSRVVRTALERLTTSRGLLVSVKKDKKKTYVKRK